MDRTGRFIRDGLWLGAAGILLRCVNVSFNAYISGRLGAEGMGLFSLVMSVYGFAVTLACSGVNLAATRLTAKAVSSTSAENVRRRLPKIMRACAIYGAGFGIAAGILLFSFAGIIGSRALADERTIPSLRALAAALPAISLSSALAGYFTGIRRVAKSVVLMIAGEAARIFLTIAGLVLLLPKGLEWACFAVVAGSALSEIIGLCFAYLMYRIDLGKVGGAQKSDTAKRAASVTAELSSASSETSPGKNRTLREVTEIAFPIAVGAYLRQGLVMLEHIAIPWGLRRSGASASAALASYGTLQSMALPVVMFPYAVIGAFTSLLVPEMTSFSERGDMAGARRAACRVISTTVFFAFCAAGIFMTFSDELGVSIYGSAEAGQMIRRLAPALPMMFLDTTVDAMLKGLGEHVYCMKVNTLDAVMSLILVLLLVPRMGINGYVTVIYASEAINAALSISKLIGVTGMKADLFDFIVSPVLSLAVSGALYPLAAYAFPRLIGVRLGAFGIALYGVIFCAGRGLRATVEAVSGHTESLRDCHTARR